MHHRLAACPARLFRMATSSMLAGYALALGACKSALGHAETGAGAVGMMRAVQALRSSSQPGILHLRALNPHVKSTLDDARKALRTGAASNERACSSARQPAPLGRQLAGSSSAVQSRRGGVSAFAFQGTNAHVTLAYAPPTADAIAVETAPVPLWQRRRFWYLPEQHALLRRTVSLDGQSGTLAFELQLARPRLAYLRDHQVTCKPTGLHVYLCSGWALQTFHPLVGTPADVSGTAKLLRLSCASLCSGCHMRDE